MKFVHKTYSPFSTNTFKDHRNVQKTQSHGLCSEKVITGTQSLFIWSEKSSSKSSPNGHSRKRTALRMATFRKPCFSQPPMIQALYFYIPINSHLQLQTPFLHPKGVCLLEFACFLSLGQQFYNKMEKKVLKSYPFGCLNSLFVKS